LCGAIIGSVFEAHFGRFKLPVQICLVIAAVGGLAFVVRAFDMTLVFCSDLPVADGLPQSLGMAALIINAFGWPLFG